MSMLFLTLTVLAQPSQADSLSDLFPTTDKQYEPQGTGLGLVVGMPSSGLSVSRRNELSTLETNIAYSFELPSIDLGFSYLRTLTTYYDPLFPEIAFPLFLGVGGVTGLHSLSSGTNTYVGVKAPFGVRMVPVDLKVPLEAWIEISPGVMLYPETRGSLSGILGLRFYPFEK